MIHSIRQQWANFRKSEDGTATVEFAIVFPIFITMFLSSVELGMISVRHTMLERGLDMAVRDIRLGTGIMPQSYDQLRDVICGYAGFVPDCEANLKIEMMPINMRNFVNIPGDADCIDHEEELNPARNFSTGNDNEMMIIRVCSLFDPIFPLTGLGKTLEVDGSNMSKLTAVTAFVQEPR